MRTKHQLTDVELSKFRRLPPYQNEALSFWRWIAKSRNLDPKTLITNGRDFTGLPVGHGKHWCFPIPLKCRKKPVYAD